MSGHPALPAAASMSSVPLVVGLGNAMAADDGVGIAVVSLLRNERQLDCEFLELRQPGLNLLPFCERRGWIAFLDGVTSGAPAGTIHLIPLPSAEVESRNTGALSTHGFGLREAVELCRFLQRPIPPLMLLGIDIQTVKLGKPQSREVEEAVQAVVAGFRSLVKHLNVATSPLWQQSHRYAPGDFDLARSTEMGPAIEWTAYIA